MATPTNISAFSNAATRGTATEMANAKELFSGVVLTSFNRKNIGIGLVTKKTIEAGSGEYFPVIPRVDEADASTYVIGVDVNISDIPVKERHISIESPVHHAIVISGLEEKILQYETRVQLSTEMGEALAAKIDKRVFTEVLIASQTSGIIAGTQMQPDGSEVNNDAIATGATPDARGDAIFASIFEADVLMDEKDVTGDKTVVLTKRGFNELIQSYKGVNRDFTSGSNGGVDSGQILRIAGLNILWTNHLPVGTAVDVDGTNKKLQGLVFTKDCVGVISLFDVSTEIDKLPLRIQEDVIKTYYWMGAGVLNPACACAITGGAA